MKVLLLNGSRRIDGCTFSALSIIKEELSLSGLDGEILHIGSEKMFDGEIIEMVKEAEEKMKESDGLVIGSPVYYSSPSGECIAFLDRFFSEAGKVLRFKPAAVIASARRAGTTASIEVLGKYPSILEMPVISSSYWNMVHGETPEDVLKDKEGVHTMKVIGRNMAWILKSIEAGKKSGVKQPEFLKKEYTNFIR